MDTPIWIGKNLLNRELRVATRVRKYERVQLIKFTPHDISVIHNGITVIIPRKDILEVVNVRDQLMKLGMLK